jgi:hypothetical protein
MSVGPGIAGLFFPFAILLYLAFWGFWIWVAWKFYAVLAGIGEELREIRKSIQTHFPPAADRSAPPPSEPARGMIT